jgi:osmotically-inducible protein OsmY
VLTKGIVAVKLHAKLLLASVFFALAGTSAQADVAPSASDQQITQQVKELIGEHPEFGSMLTVQTRNGVVYLGGTPWTQFTLSSLEPLVKQENGVTEVVVTAVYPEE